MHDITFQLTQEARVTAPSSTSHMRPLLLIAAAVSPRLALWRCRRRRAGRRTMMLWLNSSAVALGPAVMLLPVTPNDVGAAAWCGSAGSPVDKEIICFHWRDEREKSPKPIGLTPPRRVGTSPAQKWVSCLHDYAGECCESYRIGCNSQGFPTNSRLFPPNDSFELVLLSLFFRSVHLLDCPS